MMLHLDDLPRVFIALFCSGIFWMMVLFLMEKRQPWRGSTVAASALLILSAYIFLVAVSHQDLLPIVRAAR